MKKIFARCVIIILILLLGFWIISFVYCECLTLLHGDEFTLVYHENSMIGEQRKWKVLEYSESSAVVYFVEKENSFGNILSFTKIDGQWVYDQWLETVWSKTGSADGFVWPYGR